MIEIHGYLGEPGEAARAAALAADLVVAAPAVLDELGVPAEWGLPMGRVLPAIADLHARLGAPDRAADAAALDAAPADGGPSIVVLTQGDPGLYGSVRRFRADGLHPVVHVAPSSVAAAFAAVGLPWDDAQVVTVHGQSLGPALAACRALPKVAVLTAPGSGVRELAAGLADVERWYVVAARLGTPGQDVRVYDAAAARTAESPMPNVVLVLDAPPAERGALGRPTSLVGGPRPGAAVTSPHPEKAGPAVLPVAAPTGPYGDALALVLGRHLPVLGEHVWASAGLAGPVAAALARTGAAVVDLGAGEPPETLPAPELALIDDPRQLAAVAARRPRALVLFFTDAVAGAAAGHIDDVLAGGDAAEVRIEHVAVTDVDGATNQAYLATLTPPEPEPAAPGGHPGGAR